MKRIIYSVYVDVPSKEHYGESKLKYDTTEKADITVNAFKKHYGKLINSKRIYSDHLGIEFKMFQYDTQFETFAENMQKDFPMFTGYEIINFYKIHLLYHLAENYDEILYLDFDAVPLTDESFFDRWDLSKGMCVYNNNSMVKKDRLINHSIRSPTAKYFNCQAMLIDKGLGARNDVINTGIIGASRDNILKLDFFKDFSETIKLMTRLRSDTSLYPQNIIDMFRYDNETIFSYKREINKVKIQWLDNEWHYFLDTQNFIPKETKIVHCVCKDFDLVWRRYA